MINVLIVDDNEIRTKKIVKRVKDYISDEYYKIDTASNVSHGIHLMSLEHYDLLILDVVLPMRPKPSLSSAKNGLRLLKDIHLLEDVLIPKKIIGITSFKDDILDFKDKFEKYTALIIEAQIQDVTWIDKIKDNIDQLVKTDIRLHNKYVNKILITMHGIRTFGDWQEKLEELIKGKTNSFDFIHFKYGFFSILLFIFPFARNLVINKLYKQFAFVMDQNLDKKIYIVSHSFGTYIVLKILEKYKKDINIEVLIFSGSVIKSTYDLSSLLKKKVKRIINECAYNDYTLIINKIVVPTLGDAGRIGFLGYNDKSLRNRFVFGGHSIYFKNTKNKENHMSKFWVPLLVSNNFKKSTQKKDPAFYSDLTEPILSFWMLVKDFVFVSILVYSFLIIFGNPLF